MNERTIPIHTFVYYTHTLYTNPTSFNFTMQVKALLFLAALASASPQHLSKRVRPFGCSAPRPSEEHIAISEAFEIEEEAIAAAGNSSLARATINVDVYFHVVAASTSVADGYVTVCY